MIYLDLLSDSLMLVSGWHRKVCRRMASTESLTRDNVVLKACLCSFNDCNFKRCSVADAGAYLADPQHEHDMMQAGVLESRTSHHYLGESIRLTHTTPSFKVAKHIQADRCHSAQQGLAKHNNATHLLLYLTHCRRAQCNPRTLQSMFQDIWTA